MKNFLIISETLIPNFSANSFNEISSLIVIVPIVSPSSIVISFFIVLSFFLTPFFFLSSFLKSDLNSFNFFSSSLCFFSSSYFFLSNFILFFGAIFVGFSAGGAIPESVFPASGFF